LHDRLASMGFMQARRVAPHPPPTSPRVAAVLRERREAEGAAGGAEPPLAAEMHSKAMQLRMQHPIEAAEFLWQSATDAYDAAHAEHAATVVASSTIEATGELSGAVSPPRFAHEVASAGRAALHAERQRDEKVSDAVAAAMEGTSTPKCPRVRSAPNTPRTCTYYTSWCACGLPRACPPLSFSLSSCVASCSWLPVALCAECARGVVRGCSASRRVGEGDAPARRGPSHRCP
jgi:hypothetical protein